MSDIKLVHYIHLPAEDYPIVKKVWGELVQNLELANLSPDNLALGETVLIHDLPVILKNDHVAIGLSIAEGVSTIEILFTSEQQPAKELVDEIEDTRQKLDSHVDYFIGETTVAVIVDPIKEDTAESLNKPFSGARIHTSELKDAVVTLIRSDDDLRHYYIVEQKSDGDIEGFLTTRFPAADSLAFKLSRQTRYYRDQRDFINDKKNEADQGLSSILNKWAGIKSSSESNIDLLESDVEKLSSMYGELVSSLRVIKSAQNKLAQGLASLELILKKLSTDPAEAMNLKSALAEECISTLKNLELDDKLLHRSLDDTRATIEVVRTRIELERGKESVLLQKEGVSVQAAAGFIELFIVGFYTLETWELIASAEVFEHIAMSLRLGIDLSFAVMVVAFTHYAAKFIQKEKSNLGLILSGVGIVIAFGLMVLTTYYAAQDIHGLPVN